MPLLSPQDVQGIMEMLESVQQAEAAGKAPPGTYEQVLGQVESEFEYSGSPPGRSANDGFTGDWTGADPVRAPYRGEHDMPGNWERGQSMANSMAEDAMLREALGSKRKRTEDDYLEGQFPLAKYPGIENTIDVAAAGMGPAGAGAGSGQAMTPESAEDRRRWAKRARELLGLDRQIGIDETRGFRRAMKGHGAKQRRAMRRQWLGG